MASQRVVEFSNLCHTDRDLYLAYLVTNFNYGSGAVVDNKGVVGGCDGESGSGCGFVGSSFVVDFVVNDVGAKKSLDVGIGDNVVVDNDLGKLGVGVAHKRVEKPVVRLPGCHARGDGSGLASDNGNRSTGSSGGLSGTLVDVIGKNNVGKIPRGPNFERNHAARLRKKEARKLKKNGQRGYFEGCDDEVRVELRDTRAKLLILENQRRAMEEKKKIERMESPIALVKEAMSMISLAEKCAKAANDDKVSSWARKVTSSYAETLARSAPDSVPSLDSVSSVQSGPRRDRFSVDVLKMSAVEESAVKQKVLTVRQLEAERRKEKRHLNFMDFTSKNSKYRADYFQTEELAFVAGNII